MLSALPVISLGNCCCGAWILFGGGLAAYLLQQNRADPITIGDGAIVGLLAGVTGTFVSALVSVPLNLLMQPFQAQLFRDMSGNGDLPYDLRRFFERAAEGPTFATFVLGFIALLFVATLFGMIGGLFGAMMFRRPPTPVVPPPIPPEVF